MAWIDDDDKPWQPDEIELSVGRILYWLATIIAVAMVVFAVADFFIGWAQRTPILRIFAFVAAAAVWLIGRALRALLT